MPYKPKKVQIRKKEKAVDDPETQSSQASILDRHPYLPKVIEIKSSDPKRFNCLLCTRNQQVSSKGAQGTVGGAITWLKKHLETTIHFNLTPIQDKIQLKEAIQALSRPTKKDEPNPNPDDLQQGKESKEEFLPLSKSAEANLYLDLAQFMIQNHMPFDSADPLLQFIKHITIKYDQNLIERSHISRCSMTETIKNSIGDVLREKILIEMEQSPYSLLIDGSSDILGGKFLCLMVRYLNNTEDEDYPITKLLSIIEIGSVSTGEAFYEKVKELYVHNNNLRSNLIGICTDNGSNLISCRGLEVDPSGQGLVNRIKKEMPHIVHIRDACHAFNLVIEKALENFPNYIIQFIKKVSSHFSSAQRKNAFKEIQLKQGEKIALGVLSYKEIRWESLCLCTERIIKLWKYLKIYFKDTDFPMEEEFDDPEYECYLYLAYILLHKLTGYIVLFQRPKMIFEQAWEKFKESYTLFARLILKKEYQESEFEDVYPIPFDNAENELYKKYVATSLEFHQSFGEKYTRIKELIEYVKNSTRIDISKQVYGHAKDFVFEVLKSLKHRLPFENQLLKKSQVVYLKDQKLDIVAWNDLAKNFTNIVTKDKEVLFIDELDSFSLNYKTILKEHSTSTTSIVQRWHILKNNYPTLASLAKAILVIPCSTSQVESIFSEFKALKTSYRNRLSTQNLEASVLAEQHFRSDPLQILPEMIERYFEPKKKEEKKEDKPKPAGQNEIPNTDSVTENTINS